MFWIRNARSASSVENKTSSGMLLSAENYLLTLVLNVTAIKKVANRQ